MPLNKTDPVATRQNDKEYASEKNKPVTKNAKKCSMPCGNGVSGRKLAGTNVNATTPINKTQATKRTVNKNPDEIAETPARQ